MKIATGFRRPSSQFLRQPTRHWLCLGAAAIALSAPLTARAAPTELKLSFFGPERASTYQYGVKPFVDAVNAEGKGLVTIKVYFNSTLGRQAQQPQMLLDGKTDISFVVPGVTPYRFPDNVVLELPGQFRGPREGTFAYTRLVAAHALRGYEKYVVIGAYTPDPNVIHSRKPIASLADLKGQKIRANNPMEADVLARLGATPTVLEVPRIAQAIGAGAVDGTTLSPTGMVEFGVARVAPHHYLLRIGVAPLALLMSREKFDSLPAAAQALIRKYSGAWMAERWADAYEKSAREALERLSADPQQTVVTPSVADLETAHKVYRSMIADWAGKSPHNQALLRLLEKQRAAIRASD